MSNQAPNSLPVFSGSSPGSVLPAPPPSDFYYEIEKGKSLRDYIDILLRRKWWIFGTFLFTVLLVGLYTFTRTPIYRATAMVEITSDNPGSQVSAIGGRGMGLNWFAAQKFQETQNKILKSHSLAKRVIKVLDLEKYPEFARFAKSKNKTKDQILNAMAAAFVGRLSIEPIRNTNLIDISYLSSDKALSQKIIDAIPNEYLYLLIDRRNESFSLVRTWLSDQLNKMTEKVVETQQKLYKFGQKSDIYMIGNSKTGDVNNQDNIIVQKFVDLNTLLTKAQGEKMVKEAQYRQIQEQGPDAPLIVNNPLIASLRQELVVQQSKVSAMGKIYLSGHPEMQAETAKLNELRSRLNAEVSRIRDSIKADYEAATRTENLLKTSLEAQKKQMANLQDNMSNYQILKRDAQTNEQLYQALLARVKEVNISSTMVASNVSVIDPAPVPTSPFSPKKFRNMALASILGLILGVALALFVDSLDDTVKSTEDLEKNCNLPLLGTLPSLNSYRKLIPSGNNNWFRRYVPWFQHPELDTPEAGNLDLVVSKHPQDPISEALHHMETSIMLSASGRPPAAILVTSPNPSEGKSMVASNLAQSLALHGRPTVILDCDLRKPRVHKIFDLEAVPGLTNYLSGNATKEEILRQTEIPNLMVIPAGPQSPTPSNLLNSEIFKDLLVQLRQQFAHIIIDTPPILGFSDARIISVLTDGALLVTRYNVTHKAAVRLALQLFNQINAPLMGGVLNGVEASGMKYGGYQYYNYRLYSNYHQSND